MNAVIPPETENMFQGSVDLVDDCGLAYLHVFPFSPRTGTPAARMPQVARGVVKERAARLREKAADALARHLSVQVGRSVKVLAERDGIGRAPDYAEVAIDGIEPGRIAAAVISGHDGHRLIGRMCS